MTSRSFLGFGSRGFHRVAYHEWGGGARRRTLVCAHGLTRNGRDFDRLAEALQDDYRIVCPDIVGRGASDWLAAKSDYGHPQYQSDMTALIARLDVEEVDWVGTSMGGLIGMKLAAQPGTPIRRLVMNDIGALVPRAGLVRLSAYVGKDPRFPSVAAIEAHLREIYAGFGALADADWRHLAERSARPLDGGGYGLAYDPAIGRPFAEPEKIEDADFWDVWDAVRCPVLLLRGAASDLLSAATADEMTRRGPGAELRTIEGAGHAPALMDPAQIALVRDWLTG